MLDLSVITVTTSHSGEASSMDFNTLTSLIPCSIILSGKSSPIHSLSYITLILSNKLESDSTKYSYKTCTPQPRLCKIHSESRDFLSFCSSFTNWTFSFDYTDFRFFSAILLLIDNWPSKPGTKSSPHKSSTSFYEL